MAKSKMWILTANSSFAEIYEVEQGKEMHRARLIDFPDGRKKSGELENARPGRSHESVGGHRHSLESKTDTHTHEVQLFARNLAQILQKAHAEHLFDKLSLVCQPHFLGELRPLLTEQLRKNIHKEINKDLPAYLSEHERIDQLYKLLDIHRPISTNK